jgi:CHAT domain-containing protein
VFFPLITWLQEQETTSLTLIPCGQLAAFPLAAVVLPDERSVGETFPTSIAPSARSLLRMTSARSPQAGIATLGDPRENLSWSEAEALAFTTLARQTALPVEIHLKKQATREHLLTALRSRWVVNACCHGTFDSQDFLQSALLLAGKERVTMSEMLNHHADLRGLRLLLLSACQTALLDLQGARDEVHSLAVAMLQAGAQAVIAAQWAVDDKATYLLMVRFAQEWLPQMEHEPPAAALARAQAWLRCVTNQELAHWQSEFLMPARMLPGTRTSQHRTTRAWQHLPVRGRSARWQEDDAQLIVRFGAEGEEPSARSYTDPYYWAGFQVIGW